jgi:hypothetical protein
VVDRNLFAEKELSLLRALLKYKVDFMVVGLGAAALQGAPVVTQDVDLWVKELSSPTFHKALKSVGAVFVPSIGTNPPGIAGKGFELFDLVLSMSGLKNFDSERLNIEEIDLAGLRVPVLSLKRIIVSKKAANREKDKLVLPVLIDVAKAIGKRKKS